MIWNLLWLEHLPYATYTAAVHAYALELSENPSTIKNETPGLLLGIERAILTNSKRYRYGVNETLNRTDQTDQIDKMDQTDQIDQMDQTDKIHHDRKSSRYYPAVTRSYAGSVQYRSKTANTS